MSINFSNAFTIMTAIGFLIVAFILCFIAVRSALKNNQRVNRRLTELHNINLSSPVKGGSPHTAENNFLEAFGNQLTLPDAKEITRIRYKLIQAGYFNENAVKSFFSIRVLCLFIPQLIFFIIWKYSSLNVNIAATTIVGMTTIILGLITPNLFLQFRINKRTDACRRGFPDMMDLMVACIEAGLGLDATLVRVSHELGGRYPALKVNLDMMNLELRAGGSRHEAMMNFADRINLDEAKALAVMLKQAEEMGSSIGKALRTFSDDMRHKRMMRAEEKAMALSAKLTVPLILFIFPTIMTMLLMPAGLRISAGLSGGF